jgi:hypothetical protein
LDSALPQASVTPTIVEESPPALWNPNAAACWSLFLTPIFGAYLHALNWRVLGHPERAKANMIWVWATVAFLAIAIGTIFIPDSTAVNGVMRGAGIGLLVGWYVTLGKTQAEYVNQNLPHGYVKKSWVAPLGISVLAIAAYFGIVFAIVFATYSPDPQELAAEVKPLILEEWQKKPDLQGATIDNIKLEHQKGPVFTGYVEATMAGKSERLPLEVDYDGETIQWKLTDPNK